MRRSLFKNSLLLSDISAAPEITVDITYSVQSLRVDLDLVLYSRFSELESSAIKIDKSATEGGFRRRALLALYSTRINYLTLKISKCRLVRLWLD